MAALIFMEISKASDQHPALGLISRFIRNFSSDNPRPASMDSLLERLNGPTARLVLLAIASSSLTALTILSFQSLRREHVLSSIKEEARSIHPSDIHRLNSIGAEDINIDANREAQIVKKAKRGDYDEELVLEQLARNRAFFGDEGLRRIRNSFVIVVGAGGVGSWAATMLARSGVGKGFTECG